MTVDSQNNLEQEKNCIIFLNLKYIVKISVTKDYDLRMKANVQTYRNIVEDPKINPCTYKPISSLW